jgi:hypothetical protein
MESGVGETDVVSVAVVLLLVSLQLNTTKIAGNAIAIASTLKAWFNLVMVIKI